MSQRNDTGFGSITLSGTVPQYARITAAGAVATGAQQDIGTAMVGGVSGEDIAYSFANKQGTTKMIANAAITAGSPVYAADDGEVSPAGSLLVGTALESAAADQNIIEVLRVSASLPGGILAAAQQAVSGAGAINVTSYYTAWTTTGANAGTLANGLFAGQLKKIQLIVDGGDGTLTPVSLAGGTTITFADVGDYVLLLWNGNSWVPVERGNDADGATAPVIA